MPALIPNGRKTYFARRTGRFFRSLVGLIRVYVYSY